VFGLQEFHLITSHYAHSFCSGVKAIAFIHILCQKENKKRKKNSKEIKKKKNILFVGFA
jgi:hypothetical protein